MTHRLTTRTGAPARVAMLVYNDCHNDARVLKEAQSLREAGAVVRIFAVARHYAGRPAGLSQIAEGITLQRAREFDLADYAPFLTRLTRRGTASSGPTGAVSAPAPTDTPPPTAATPRLTFTGTALRPMADITYRAILPPAMLVNFWRHSVSAALHWEPDIVHANDGNTLAPAMAIARRTGARIIYDSHELWLHRNVARNRVVAPVVEAMIERAGIRRASGVVTVSPSIAAWLQEKYRLSEAPTLVRNVPGASPPPDGTSGRLRELAGLTPRDRVIAYSGRFTTSRGIEETIEALPHLDSDVHVVLLGYGEDDYVATVRAAADRAGVSDRVHLVPPVAPDEVADALSDGDVAIVHVRPTCLSYRFALPNKLFESIRGGLPVAAADLPDIRDVVRGLGVGEVFADDEPATIARTIERVLANSAEYRRNALAAAATLTWEREADGLLALYERVLEGGRS